MKDYYTQHRQAWIADIDHIELKRRLADRQEECRRRLVAQGRWLRPRARSLRGWVR